MPDARRLLLALSAAATAAGMLIGCPIPQPLPGVGNTDAGVAPPRILFDSAHPSATFVPYDDTPGACDGGGPQFVVTATVVDQNPDDVVEGRWFVDYDPDPNHVLSNAQQTFTFVPVLPDQTSHGAAFPFTPTDPALSGFPVQVVELVVSNGFAPETPDGGLPNRAPRPGYETQVYRWVFQPVDGGAACGP